MTSYEAQTKLGQLRMAYPNARSTTRQVVEQAIKLADELVHDAEVAAEARADGRIEQAERQVEQHRHTADVLRTRTRQLEEQLAEKRRLYEERQESGEEVQVKIGRSLGGSWTIGDLEEIIYRLRCGGGTDDTPVTVNDYTATAKVVAPNLVPLVRPDAGKVDREIRPDMDIVEKAPPPNPDRVIAFAVVVACVAFMLFDVVRWVL